MKGTILDFLKLATEKPELANELFALASKYDFEFTDEVSDEQLEDVAGGTLASMSEQIAQEMWETEAAKAEPLLNSTADYVQRLMETMKELSAIQQSTFDNTIR